MNEHAVFHGDCAQVLPETIAKPMFDLIYVDPPFNAGGHRRARQGSGERIDGVWAYKDFWGGVEAFLEMLEPRLAVLRDVLTDTGSLWVHLDHRTVHDVKVSLDRLFGRAGFQGEVVWLPGNGGKRRNGPSVTHQTILIYSRAKQMIWNDNTPELREPFAATSLRMHFNNVDEDGRRYRERVIAGKSYRYYAEQGRRRGSVWDDCPAMNANTPLTKETTGYPTQKPLKLLDRIIRAASAEGSRVLDPMCGSGTTLVAAAASGRHATGVDLSEVACGISARRLEQLKDTEGRTTTPRARRSPKAIRQDA